MQNNQVELLAPAGNTEGFYGAIHAGADAVYLGGNRFGARAYAENFTTEELISCIRYAHLWCRKVYLTVNTLIKESEFQELYEYIYPFYDAGLDGVIVQDIGVLVYIKENFPDMEIHVSTQMTLTGEYGAAMLKEMGACRIVPARELSLKEIRQIKKQTGLSIETFIHGAMCYCYSGQCLFSSILGGRSGNRGRCAQPCRLPYRIMIDDSESEECYPLSLKDMCTIEHIPDLIRAGIDSFKIEGRMKKPEYTAGVTAIYRKYIDNYYKTEGKAANSEVNIDSKDLKALSCLYIRSERQDGYYYKHNGRDMITLSSPAYSGSDEELLARIRKQYLDVKQKMSVSVYANFRTGNKASVTFVSDDIRVTVEGDVVQAASKQPISDENIKKQLSKLGDSIFSLTKIEIEISDDAFYPLRAINELRREAIVLLENAIIQKNGFQTKRIHRTLIKGYSREEAPSNQTSTSKEKYGRFILFVRNMEQLLAVEELLTDETIYTDILRIYVDCDLFAHDAEEVLKHCKVLCEFCDLVIALPYIIRERAYSYLENKVFPYLIHYSDVFSGILIRSMEGMGIIKRKAYQGNVYTDAGFYIWNRKTLQKWADTVSGFCMPYELKSGEQRKLLGLIPAEKIVYGRIPMMITANCVANTSSGCRKGAEASRVQLIDRYHKKFPVELNCIHCMNIIYNSVPLSLHGELYKWAEAVDFRLNFTVESKQETKAVIRYFIELRESGYRDTAAKPPFTDYTTGHEKRGVE